jgi:hypothetical protein
VTKAEANAERIFKTAAHFAASASLLDAECARLLSAAQGPVDLPFLIPARVCIAFSVELYLKCLGLLETGTVPRTHSLKVLYSRLSTTSRAAIAQRFEELMGASPSAQAMKAKFPDVSFAIDDVLAIVSTVFEEWRYAYEDQAGSAYGLRELSEAVRERIDDVQAAV